jgi:predicted dinucleotide-binding enzyme
MPQAEMVVRLLEQARMCAGSAHTTVAQLQALTAAADCYRVISSNLSETAAAVAALTEQSVRAQLRL